MRRKERTQKLLSMLFAILIASCGTGGKDPQIDLVPTKLVYSAFIYSSENLQEGSDGSEITSHGSQSGSGAVAAVGDASSQEQSLFSLMLCQRGVNFLLEGTNPLTGEVEQFETKNEALKPAELDPNGTILLDRIEVPKDARILEARIYLQDLDKCGGMAAKVVNSNGEFELGLKKNGSPIQMTYELGGLQVQEGKSITLSVVSLVTALEEAEAIKQIYEILETPIKSY